MSGAIEGRGSDATGVAADRQRTEVRLTVNGAPVAVVEGLDRSLLQLLRDELDLTGTKEGCGIGVCGACSVLVDGQLSSSCLAMVGLLDGAGVTTVEGLGSPEEPSAVQRAFVDAGGLQCGICTPGQVVAAHALLAEQPDPDEAAIRTWLAGNLCRCTGYAKIVAAVRLAAATRVATEAAKRPSPTDPLSTPPR